MTLKPPLTAAEAHRLSLGEDKPDHSDRVLEWVEAAAKSGRQSVEVAPSLLTAKTVRRLAELGYTLTKKLVRGDDWIRADEVWLVCW